MQSVVLHQKATAGHVLKIGECGILLSPKWDINIAPLLQGSKNTVEEQEGSLQGPEVGQNCCKTVSFRCNRAGLFVAFMSSRH